MQWQNVRQHYPNQWLLIEASNATSQGNKRIVNQLAVLGTFTDSTQALKKYLDLHRQVPTKELYVVHTSRESLDITERRGMGIRPAR